MNAPEEMPESDVSAMSTLSAGSSCGELPRQDSGSATTHASSKRSGPVTTAQWRMHAGTFSRLGGVNVPVAIQSTLKQAIMAAPGHEYGRGE